MSKRILFFAFAIFAGIFFLVQAALAAETGNICNEGCPLDSSCGGSAPYLCKKSWAFDTCVAKGYDSGYCGGKTDNGGYCFECSGGCVLQSELGGQCGLFTTCNADEYCCRRAEWYESNICKPKYSDMGCCGGPPAEGDKTTFLKATIDNNKGGSCTDKIEWEVKAEGSSEFADYSAECVEGNPKITIGGGKSMEATCTSQKLPTAASGPHKEKITWCGESAETEYGHALGAPDVQILWPENEATVSRQYKTTFVVKIADDDVENDEMEKLGIKVKFDEVETMDFVRMNEPNLPGAYLTMALPSKASTTVTITVTNSKSLSTSVSANLKLEDSYVLVFQPIGWTGDWAAFDAMVDRHASKILENTPLKECPNKLKVIKSHQNYQIDRNKLDDDCWMYFDSIANDIRTFVASNYDEYGTIIAIGDGLGCGGIVGMAVSSDFVYNLKSNSNDIGGGSNSGEAATLHELGHTWGFDEQYVYNQQSNSLNPIQSELSCNPSICEKGKDRIEFFDSCYYPDSLKIKDDETCKTKTKDCCCVLEIWSNRNYCAGNTAKDGIGRSFMGWTEFTLTGFDENEWNHINQIPVLTCS